MITVRKSEDRGHFDHGWLNTYHTFSFGQYHDSEQMGFRSLRVINEDRVQPSAEFGDHPHKDMEIISYVLEGQLAHRDSMGSGSVIRPGDIQRMTAGTGVIHGEANLSRTNPAHFLQIWIKPREKNLPPAYEQKRFESSQKAGRLCLLASPDGRDGSVVVNQDVLLYSSILDPGQKVATDLAADRHAWLQVVRGSLKVNDVKLNQGDGARISDENWLEIIAAEQSELLLFDLA